MSLGAYHSKVIVLAHATVLCLRVWFPLLLVWGLGRGLKLGVLTSLRRKNRRAAPTRNRVKVMFQRNAAAAALPCPPVSGCRGHSAVE